MVGALHVVGGLLQGGDDDTILGQEDVPGDQVSEPLILLWEPLMKVFEVSGPNDWFGWPSRRTVLHFSVVEGG